MGRGIIYASAQAFERKLFMEYAVSCRKHRESETVFSQSYPLREGDLEFSAFSCTASVSGISIEQGREYRLTFHFHRTLGFPVSTEFSFVVENWKKEGYVFMPGAVYNGNRFHSLPIAYPPYHKIPKEEALTAPSVITDIPHLSCEDSISTISLLAGDMTVPSVGFFSPWEKKGVLVFAPHRCGMDSTGFTVREDISAGTLQISVTAPGVREKYRYFFGERRDGSGFYPDSHTDSDDTGRYFEADTCQVLTVRVYEFPADNLADFFAFFNRKRECFETGSSPDVVPFSAAYRAISQKFQEKNFVEEGFLGVDVRREIPQNFWQAGWVGGGISSYPLLLEGTGRDFNQALSTFRFILDKLQFSSGWVCGIYANGITYGDDFDFTKPGTVLLIRKAADLLYFLLKQAMVLRDKGFSVEEYHAKLMAFCDAFGTLFKKYGQIGQYIDAATGEMLVGNSASGAIASAGLALAYEYFGETRYLETASQLGEFYYNQYVSKGILNGGPGEICQAPDSESAFGMLESYVQLYETTGDPKWLSWAKETFEQAITWVMSYDFSFPPESVAGRRGVHTLGTVFANAQNKHSAPGICTLSGNSLLKLYRFTGEEKYLFWQRAIAHSIPQFVSLKERPILTLENLYLPEGFVNERVQTSDWEGKETVGGFLYGSNWPEVTMLLTYVEIPGIYVDFGRGKAVAFDHIGYRVIENTGNIMVLELENHTDFDAEVTVLADDSSSLREVTHNYFNRMEKVKIPAGACQRIQVCRPEKSSREERKS